MQSSNKIPIHCRRMVTIIAGVVPVGNERTTANGSGFLISLSNKTWLVTAGHVARDLQIVHAAKRLYRLMLCDAWSNSGGTGSPVVFPVDRLSDWIIFGDENSYDVAILELGLNLSTQLEKGHIETVPEAEWRNPWLPFDSFEIVGTPGEFLKSNETQRQGPRGEDVRSMPTEYDVGRVVLTLKAIPCPKNDPQTSASRFYAKLVAVPNGVKLNDITGVSGGPVLGVTKSPDGSKTYHTIAVQSAWFPDAQIVVADYLYHLPDMIKAVRI